MVPYVPPCADSFHDAKIQNVKASLASHNHGLFARQQAFERFINSKSVAVFSALALHLAGETRCAAQAPADIHTIV